MHSQRRYARPVGLVWTLSIWLAGGTLFAQSREEYETDDPPAEAKPEAAMPNLNQVEQMIVTRTNRFREKQGRSAVDADQRLRETAQYFADFMARTEKYGHTADGSRPSQRATKHGYEFCIVLENIGYRYSSTGFDTEELARGFVKGWRNSSGHRENMLDPNVTETGVAVAHSEETGNYYAVQMFGRPRTDNIRFRVLNRTDERIEYSVSPASTEEGRAFDLPSQAIRTHQRCRPSQLQFAFEESANYSVQDGTQYVLTADESGTVRVREEELSSAGAEPDR